MSGIADDALSLPDAHPFLAMPPAPAESSALTMTAEPVYWKAMLDILMEAPVPGRITGPVIGPLAQMLQQAGHLPT